MKPGVRLLAYRFFQTAVIRRWLLPRWISRDWLASLSQLPGPGQPMGRDRGMKRPVAFSAEMPVIWFHAASVGELESLVPLVDFLRQSDAAVVLSAFSESAAPLLNRLAGEARARGLEVIYAGISPWEGDWERAFAAIRPRVFVTSKYEAWPDLWASLSRTNTPLVITGAQARSSLRWAARVCTFLGVRLPELVLLPSVTEDSNALRKLFPESKVEVVGDSRWDRVFQRATRGSSRARELIARAEGFPRPWCILGSAWEQDFVIWREWLQTRPEGTIWVVPHKIDEASLLSIESKLRDAGVATWIRSKKWVKEYPEADSLSERGRPRVILVDEMGFLSELYSCADWAYVGGGFGEGVHSTIEPAIRGIPVAIGPAGSGRFPEVGQLVASSQLRIIHTSDELAHWWRFATTAAPGFRESWILQARGRLGASKRIGDRLLDILAKTRELESPT